MTALPELVELREHFRINRAQVIDDISALVGIPSVSALPEHRTDIDHAATWLADRLRRAEVPTVEVMQTAGHPIVWGSWPAPPGRPTILIYGHYDTQPAGPNEEWHSDPFKASVREGRLYGRGATDDKGNLMIPVAVTEAYARLATRPPVGLIFLFEGEEEVGSPSLVDFIASHSDRLRADYAVSADSAMWGHDEPSLILGSRGLVALQLDAYGAPSDLHSGLHGGLAPNPLNALASVLASMKAPNGRITIEGFDTGIRPLADLHERDHPFDAGTYSDSVGIPAIVGDPAYSPVERNSIRPTLDVNGIWGGFQGTGSQMIIPAEGHAKVSCRLVADQDPNEVIHAIRSHVARHCPPGVTMEVRSIIESSRAYTIDPHHHGFSMAREALAASYGRDPHLIYMGASLPVAAIVKSMLDIETVFLAWEMPDENLHGPNEFLRLENLDRGLMVYADFFRRLGEQAHEYESDE
ncbi:dipeptidase [Phytohabitans kaempferiae]|uniref:Dipeptidase n=1 Tax=Phytohabitans kaempferiae TaxID=1620943 RepID=A0ABV6LY66_9ACTN